jgi:Sulfotransferase family
MNSSTDHPAPAAPILVTGAHRTGTTWVGKILTASRQAAYISEPLNILHRPGVFSAPTRYWYTYLCAENENEYQPGLLQTLQFRYHALAELRSLRSFKDVGRMGRDCRIFLSGRLYHLRPLLKDPFAVFSAPWFYNRLGCQVVITVRHPGAFASSLKRLDWPFDLRDLLNQPLLMRDWLEPFRGEMEEMAKNPDDVIGQSCLLWRMVYQIVEQFKLDYPQFQVVRHEDLSLEPVDGYRALYTALGLSFTPRAEQAVLSSSSSENPAELSKRAIHSVRLDSQANLNNWKRRLSSEEMQRIRQLTEEVAARYYPEMDWT